MESFFTLSDDSWIDSTLLEKKTFKRKALTLEQKEQMNLKRRKNREEKIQAQNLNKDLNNKIIELATLYEKSKIENHKLASLLNISQSNEAILKEENTKLRIKLEYVNDENSKLIILKSKIQDKCDMTQDRLDEILEENVKLKIKEIEYDKCYEIVLKLNSTF